LHVAAIVKNICATTVYMTAMCGTQKERASDFSKKLKFHSENPYTIAPT